VYWPLFPEIFLTDRSDDDDVCKQHVLRTLSLVSERVKPIEI
jgi:hypothetical protein